MTAAEVLPPEPPEDRDPTGWEREHLTDPRDDAGGYYEMRLPGISAPTLDAHAEHRARLDAEAERDYWRDQYLNACATLREIEPRFRGGRR